jgi:hypothetical protein
MGQENIVRGVWGVVEQDAMQDYLVKPFQSALPSDQIN